MKTDRGASTVLVIDDLPDFLAEMKKILSSPNITVITCPSPLKALRDLRRRPVDLVITTLMIRELGGFDIIRAIRSSGSSVPIMMITGYGSPQAAIEATRLGATDYLDKPINTDELRARVNRILNVESARLAGREPDSSGELITSDPAMQALMETVQILAQTSSRVLIMGETGTGKQLIARAIHRASDRKNEPFVDINCAAIPDALLESELFGHEQGAFTGASEQRIGRFEEAGAGTLFLDEIGEMGYSMQAKLLKVLEDARFSRVGGSKQQTCRARIIAATNRELETEVAQGRFRSDLFFRLQVMTLVLPPLRRRPSDIPLLARHFLAKFTPPKQPVPEFSAETLQVMMRYSWPGNVRELENTIERIAVLHRSSIISPEALPDRILHALGVPRPSTTTGDLSRVFDGTYHEAKTKFEVSYVTEVLKQASGNMAEAARLAGLDRSQFFRMVKRHKLDPRMIAASALISRQPRNVN